VYEDFARFSQMKNNNKDENITDKSDLEAILKHIESQTTLSENAKGILIAKVQTLEAKSEEA
jgi:hypothetical protein